MKQTTRLLALSALVLAVMMAVLGVPALEAPGVAHAQGTVPAAPTGLTAQRSGASTINLSWQPVTGAVRYQVYSWDATDGWTRLDGGADNPHTTTTFSHTGLTANRLYYYQVYGVNAQGDRGPRSNRVNEVAGTEAPDRPSLTVTPGYLVNVISWPAVTGATSYVLYTWDQSWDNGVTVNGTSYTDTGLTAGRTYYYEAQAVNANGVRSAYSVQASATVLSTPTVTAPVNLSAGTTPQDQQVTLTWGSPPGATGITGYQYRYAMSSADLSAATWMDAGMDMTETITGLTNGTQYTFEVRAMSSTGEGPAASVMATPAAVPDAPELTATEGYRTVMLRWEAPDDNGAPISAYRIELLNAQNQWVTETSLPGSATTYTDSGLRDSAVYIYRIIAINAAGDSSASNSADATTLAQPAQVPSAPASLTAVAGSGKVTLTWTAPLFNGGSPVTRYEYSYKVVGASSYGSWTSNMLKLTVDVEPLTPGTAYHFQVRAVNSVGPGAVVNNESVTAGVTPTATGPTAVPQNVRATLRTHAGTAVSPHQSNAEITVSWDVVPATANGGDTGGITGYELCYKKSTDSAWMRWVTGTGFGAPSTTGTVRTAVHGEDAAGGLLDPGTTYQYRVRALNSVALAGTADACESDVDWSSAVSATTPIVEPEAPTLYASDTTPALQNRWVMNVNSITIKWMAPTLKGGADITGYEVWVGTPTENPADGVGTAECVAGAADSTAVTALPPTVTGLPAVRMEYISPGLTADQVYCFRVRARNHSTDDSRVSLWSAEVRARTTVTQAGTPGAPTLTDPTEAPALSGTVPVSWTAPNDQGTTPITSYEVQYQRTDDGGSTPGTEDGTDAGDWSDASTTFTPTPPTALTWTHMQAPGLSTFRYRVRAVNGSGGGAWAESAAATTVPARAADAPELTATAVGDDEILLQWTKPGDNGSGFTGYEIERRDDSAATPAWDTTFPIAVADADTTLHSDRGADTNGDGTIDTPLTAGTKYSYRIRTTGGTPEAADFTADDGPMASATTTAGTPAMPVFTSATPGTGDDADSITLVWTAPNSGGSPITGYLLHRWDGSKWAELARPAAGATMYKDDGLAPGTRYYYILAATNGAYGPWSAAVSAMTAAGAPDRYRHRLRLDPAHLDGPGPQRRHHHRLRARDMGQRRLDYRQSARQRLYRDRVPPHWAYGRDEVLLSHPCDNSDC